MNVHPSFGSKWFDMGDTHLTFGGTILEDISFMEASTGPVGLGASMRAPSLRASTVGIGKAGSTRPRVDRGASSRRISLAGREGLRGLAGTPEHVTALGASTGIRGRTVVTDRLAKRAALAGNLAAAASFRTRVAVRGSTTRIDLDAAYEPTLEGAASP